MSVSYLIAQTPEHFKISKLLFEEYATSLNVDLCFQGFDEELRTIDILYNLPKGCLLLAFDNDKPIGCAAIRQFEDNIAELKRMYLKPECRGKKIGEKLLTLIIDKAKQLDFLKIRLDTLPQMKEAQQLYRKFGFLQINSYRFNPVEGTIYLEKDLKDKL